MKMTNVKIKSVLEECTEVLFTINDLKQAKEYVIDFVNNRGIKDADKINIVRGTNESKSLIRLQTYVCNALLKYEGLSVNKPTTDK
jgi:hypothetical protein